MRIVAVLLFATTSSVWGQSTEPVASQPTTTILEPQTKQTAFFHSHLGSVRYSHDLDQIVHSPMRHLSNFAYQPMDIFAVASQVRLQKSSISNDLEVEPFQARFLPVIFVAEDLKLKLTKPERPLPSFTPGQENVDFSLTTGLGWSAKFGSILRQSVGQGLYLSDYNGVGATTAYRTKKWQIDVVALGSSYDPLNDFAAADFKLKQGPLMVGASAVVEVNGPGGDRYSLAPQASYTLEPSSKSSLTVYSEAGPSLFNRLDPVFVTEVRTVELSGLLGIKGQVTNSKNNSYWPSVSWVLEGRYTGNQIQQFYKNWPKTLGFSRAFDLFAQDGLSNNQAFHYWIPSRSNLGGYNGLTFSWRLFHSYQVFIRNEILALYSKDGEWIGNDLIRLGALYHFKEVLTVGIELTNRLLGRQNFPNTNRDVFLFEAAKDRVYLEVYLNYSF